MKIIELEEVDSTNEYCKRNAELGDIIVVAKRQTAGKGTKGRSFCSADGGIYISVMKKYSDFPVDQTFKIMVNACVAVCKTIESYGVSPQIRWANDVLVGGKKICGTLIENTFRGSDIVRSIVGMGFNINNILPDELFDIATTLSQHVSQELEINEVLERLFNNLEYGYTISDYKSYMGWLGSEVTLKTQDGERRVIAKDIDGDGRLVVLSGNKIEKISSAEVTLRL